jgi:hypothetical protein
VGSSIAAPAAAGWVTDFLNAGYYAQPEPQRALENLRLAHGILTTRWAGLGDRRLEARDLAAFNRAYGSTRLRARGRLDHETLLTGASRLIGPWFPNAWADDARRGFGIAFETVERRQAYVPETRLAHAALGPLTPPQRSPADQHWATYDPVSLPDPDGALMLLQAPARWPDIGCATGRFTAMRSGGLLGQTFEIEVVAEPTPRSPVFTRGYVTCTTLAIGDADPELGAAVHDLEERYRAGAGADARPMLPTDAIPLALVILTTHEGHFLGPARSHLLVWRDSDGAWIRDVGAWDPLPPYLAVPYEASGRAAQQAFWGPAPADRSMLAQLALVSQATPLRDGGARR